MKFIKPFITVFAFCLGTSAFAKNEYPNYLIHLDWSSPNTLSDNIVMQCDDSYIPEIELLIPGIPGKDFSVYIDSANITMGKPEFGCSVKLQKGENSAKYIIDGHAGGCTIEVRQRVPYKPGQRNEPKKAIYEITDAC